MMLQIPQSLIRLTRMPLPVLPLCQLPPFSQEQLLLDSAVQHSSFFGPVLLEMRYLGAEP